MQISPAKLRQETPELEAEFRTCGRSAEQTSGKKACGSEPAKRGACRRPLLRDDQKVVLFFAESARDYGLSG